MILDTLALVQQVAGDNLQAIETKKKALLVMPQDAPDRSDLETALAKYEAALLDEAK